MGSLGDDDGFVEVEDDDVRLPVNQDPPVIYQYFSACMCNNNDLPTTI